MAHSSPPSSHAQARIPSGAAALAAPASAAMTPALRHGLIILSLTLMIAIAAQVRVYLPGNPVPITLQTLAVILCGLWARPMQGSAACALYLALGAVGAPVFADFSGGFRVLAGPTAGYLLGFLLVPALVHALSRRADGRRRSWFALLLVGLIAHAAVLAPGLAWLKIASGQPWGWALAMGLIPFIPGSILKAAVAAGAAGR